jgi:hypothetical protein
MIYGYADPRRLTDLDLAKEHRFIHEISKRDSSEHPDCELFWASPYNVSCLLLRHELVRAEANMRWPGKHKRGVHPTPVLWKYMAKAHKQMYVTYAHTILHHRQLHVGTQVSQQLWFARRMKDLKFPDRRGDTPWDQQGLLIVEYLQTANDKIARANLARRRKFKSGRRH